MMIKKNLKQIEMTSYVLMFIGIIMRRLIGMAMGGIVGVVGVIVTAIGILLWVFMLIYKSMNWQEYRKDNIKYIFMMLFVIILMFVGMIFGRA